VPVLIYVRGVRWYRWPVVLALAAAPACKREVTITLVKRDAGRALSTSTSTSTSTPTVDDDAGPPCPDGMRFVSGSYCPRVARECLRSEENGANHITICHAFAHETTCLDDDRTQERAFCIDQYEYPNEHGAHPTWMVTWYDAQATCESKGKRLCYESEWTMACEGPDQTPFPYGWERDNTACNIDNQWIAPRIEVLFGLDAGTSEGGAADASARELERIDQGVASGALPGCVSGFGVHDMTGNFDEWVTNDQPISPRGADTSMWAALKGGAWGHVRNACRPLTTSHSPGFSYYNVSFRCCADASGYPVYAPPGAAYPPPKVAAGDKAPRVVERDGGAVGPSKVKVPPQN
jgi:hypothetical protein